MLFSFLFFGRGNCNSLKIYCAGAIKTDKLNETTLTSDEKVAVSFRSVICVVVVRPTIWHIVKEACSLQLFPDGPHLSEYLG